MHTLKETFTGEGSGTWVVYRNNLRDGIKQVVIPWLTSFNNITLAKSNEDTEPYQWWFNIAGYENIQLVLYEYVQDGLLCKFGFCDKNDDGAIINSVDATLSWEGNNSACLTIINFEFSYFSEGNNLKAFYTTFETGGYTKGRNAIILDDDFKNKKFIFILNATTLESTGLYFDDTPAEKNKIDTAYTTFTDDGFVYFQNIKITSGNNFVTIITGVKDIENEALGTSKIGGGELIDVDGTRYRRLNLKYWVKD